VISTYLGEQDITPLCKVNQSIPKITSRPSDGSKVRLARKVLPSVVILTPLQILVDMVVSKGDMVSMDTLHGVISMPCSHANLDVT
jgi:hypothetical protein